MNIEEVRSRLQCHVKDYGTQHRAAEALQVSDAYLCYVLKGKRKPSAKLLKAIGIQKKTLEEYCEIDA